MNLVEIFSSVQGEGAHVGASTLFIRFGECDLRCRWCDSPHTWKPAAQCRVETARGTGKFLAQSNPVALEHVLSAAEALDVDVHQFTALTGGEPLLQPEAVRDVARALRVRGPRILLETAGLAASGLEAVIEEIDVVSMDWKLTSDVRRAADPRHGPVEPFHAAHERFLQVACHAPEVVVKVVVTTASEDEEIDEAVARVRDIAPRAVFIVQPVTPIGAVRETPSAERLLGLCARIESKLPRVRLIPQTHKNYRAL